jgi:hypothetical protein
VAMYVGVGGLGRSTICTITITDSSQETSRMGAEASQVLLEKYMIKRRWNAIHSKMHLSKKSKRSKIVKYRSQI